MTIWLLEPSVHISIFCPPLDWGEESIFYKQINHMDYKRLNKKNARVIVLNIKHITLSR